MFNTLFVDADNLNGKMEYFIEKIDSSIVIFNLIIELSFQANANNENMMCK